LTYGFWLPLWYFGHCIVSPSTYGFWLPLWYSGHCIVCSSTYGFWLPLWYFGHCIVCSSTYGFWLPLWYFGHWVVSPSTDGFWLPLWYFGDCIVSPSTLASGYPVGIFKLFFMWCIVFHFTTKTTQKLRATRVIYTTLTGQKYFHTKIFPYIFHIKPFIFKTFSWSHCLSDFHDIFSIKCRNKYSFFVV
jgi:hypothetical protein